MGLFWELPIDPRNVFPNWFIGNTDPALDLDNHVSQGKPWIQTENDTGPWGDVLGLFVRNEANDDWISMLSSGPEGPQGDPGVAGDDGDPGSVFYNGSGAPSGGLGVDGDYYIDVQSADYYTKITGAWTLVGNLRGSTGYRGPEGDEGPPGFEYMIPGPQGNKGDTGVGLQGFPGLTIPGMDGDEGEMGMPIPGNSGTPGGTGNTGSPGAAGLTIPGLDGDEGEMGFPIPGNSGATGAAGSNGTIGVDGKMGIPGLDGDDADEPLMIPGPMGPVGTGRSMIGVADVAIANTETVVAQLAVPKGELLVGMTFAIESYATRAGASNASPIIRIRVGGTTLTGNIAATLTPPTNTLAVGNVIRGLVTIRSIGGAGTVQGMLVNQVHLAAVTIQPAVSAFTTPVAVDTTVDQLIELTFISGNASNTYTFRNATIYRVHPQIGAKGDTGAPGSPVTCRMRRSTTLSLPYNTFTAIPLNTDDEDTEGAHDTGSNTEKYVAQQTKTHTFSVYGKITLQDSGGAIYFVYMLNGITYTEKIAEKAYGVITDQVFNEMLRIYLTAADTIAFGIIQLQGSTNAMQLEANCRMIATRDA